MTPALANDLVAENVTNMSVLIAGGSDDIASSVTVELTFQRKNKTYTGSQVIAIRNRPIKAETFLLLQDAVIN